MPHRCDPVSAALSFCMMSPSVDLASVDVMDPPLPGTRGEVEGVLSKAYGVHAISKNPPNISSSPPSERRGGHNKVSSPLRATCMYVPIYVSSFSLTTDLWCFRAPPLSLNTSSHPDQYHPPFPILSHALRQVFHPHPKKNQAPITPAAPDR